MITNNYLIKEIESKLFEQISLHCLQASPERVQCVQMYMISFSRLKKYVCLWYSIKILITFLTVHQNVSRVSISLKKITYYPRRTYVLLPNLYPSI